MQVEKELHELSAVLFFQRGELLAEQTVQTVLRDGRHLNDDKARGERFIQLARAGVAVVHRADEARGGVDRHAVVAGDVDGAAEVQRGVQHGKSLIFGHVDLVEHAEAPVLRAEVDGAGAEGHLSVFKGVHADEPGGIHADVEGNVPRGAAEGLRQIFGQHVLAGRLAAGEQQVLAAQQRGDGGLPDLFPIIMIARLRDAALQRRLGGVLCAVGADAVEQRGADVLLL